MQTYIIKRAGFLMGRYRSAGTEVEMPDRQARLYLLEGRVEVKRPDRPAQPKRSTLVAKKREEAKDAPDNSDAAS